MGEPSLQERSHLARRHSVYVNHHKGVYSRICTHVNVHTYVLTNKANIAKMEWVLHRWLVFSHVKYITVRCATVFIFVQKDFRTAACGETWLFLSTWQAEARQSLSSKPVPGQPELCRETVSKNHKGKRLAGCGGAHQ